MGSGISVGRVYSSDRVNKVPGSHPPPDVAAVADGCLRSRKHGGAGPRPTGVVARRRERLRSSAAAP